ncbi:MAG: YceD family protein [Methylococcales bacterium]|nr:YceD family protein [Methylococcales bacterium]
MSFHLPARINPRVLANKQGHVAGQIDLAQCLRLAEHLHSLDGTVNIDLRFARLDGKPVIQGRVQAALELVCQRCLDALAWQDSIAVNLMLIEHSSQAETLTTEYEPLLLTEDTLTLVELVEDELLLAIPDCPRHETECQPKMIPPQAVKEPARANPFAQLAELKTNGVTHGSSKK